ncbi:MAG: hypothetical protein ACFCAD_14280 [Pleurocapsa sp.]
MTSLHFSDRVELPIYYLSAKKIVKFLLTIIFFLIVLNLIERIYISWFNINHESQIVSYYFNFDQEFNLPSLYSALALGFSSYLLSIIAVIKKGTKSSYARYWKTLAFIFLYLGIDEACSIHELLNPIVRKATNAQGFFYFAWVIPAFFLLAIFLLIFRKFIFHLPIQTRTLFVLAGFIYVGGALGMELIGGYIADNLGYNRIYGIVSSIEEILEMLGIVIFIYGLLTYIQSQINELHFSLSFQAPIKKINQRTKVS